MILGLELLGIELLFVDRVRLWLERKRGLCYRGDIIEESLSDKLILKRVKIVSTEVHPVTAESQTLWLSQWTIHTVEFLEKRGPKVAERLAESLEEAHPWYADFKNDTHHYIIFRNKIFSIDRTKPAEYQAAREYGLSLGIPAHQLDFESNVI